MFEIFFEDLKEDCQQRILEQFGISSPEKMNWDIFPLATIAIDPEDSDKNPDKEEP